MTVDTLEELAARVPAAMRSTPEQALLCDLVRPTLALLAHGEPVSIDEIAAAAARSPEEARTALDQLPCIEWDEQRRVVGMGLSLRPTPHHIELAGRTLFTWCALDALMIPALLGTPARVVSPCRATGEPVRMTVTSSGVEALDPSCAVMSIVDTLDLTRIRVVFCDRVHFFYSPTVASRWLDEHAGAAIVSVADGFRLGQLLVDRCCERS